MLPDKGENQCWDTDFTFEPIEHHQLSKIKHYSNRKKSYNGLKTKHETAYCRMCKTVRCLCQKHKSGKLWSSLMKYILSFGLARTQTRENFPQMDPLGLALPKVLQPNSLTHSRKQHCSSGPTPTQSSIKVWVSASESTNESVSLELGFWTGVSTFFNTNISRSRCSSGCCLT